MSRVEVPRGALSQAAREADRVAADLARAATEARRGAGGLCDAGHDALAAAVRSLAATWSRTADGLAEDVRTTAALVRQADRVYADVDGGLLGGDG